jgi:nifR3 family TIM-barrel protein
MENVTDPSFRAVCKKYGADMVYTEFVSSDELIKNGRKALKKLDIYENERPIGIQIYGHDLANMVAAVQLVEQAQPDLIDINFGCPAKKIAARGAGSGMLANVPLMVQITEAIVKSTKLPVTVKTRIGYDECTKNIVEVAEQLQDVGIQALTIHGRTRAQMYRGEADWNFIAAVKNNPRMKIPVIGNGDITTGEKAYQAFHQYGVDGIMIGRGAIGRPWIFKEIKYYLSHGNTMPALNLEEKTELALLHFQESIKYKGEPRGIYEMRRHLVNYFAGVPGFEEKRGRLVRSLDKYVVEQIISSLNVYEPVL